MQPLQGAFAREGADARHGRRLAASGIRSYRQMTQRPLWDVAHAADFSVDAMAAMIARVSVRLAPQGRTAFDLFLDGMNHPTLLRTGLTTLDAACRGGLHAAALYELAGAAGIGKSQLAMTLAVRCAMDYPTDTVHYYETERAFCVQRLCQIAKAHIANRFHGRNTASELDDRVRDVLARIRVARVATLQDLSMQLQQLSRNISAWKVRLVIVDSVAAVFAHAHDLTMAQKDHHLLRLTRQLKSIGDLYQVFLVVTNRAATVVGEDGFFTQPMLGDTWAHCVTSRLVLERHSSSRAITVLKSPAIGRVSQPFCINESGVVPWEQDPPTASIDDDDFSVHDDMLQSLELAAFPIADSANTLSSTQQCSSIEDAEDELELDEQDPGNDSVEVVNNAYAPDDDIVGDSNEEEDSDDA